MFSFVSVVSLQTLSSSTVPLGGAKDGFLVVYGRGLPVPPFSGILLMPAFCGLDVACVPPCFKILVLMEEPQEGSCGSLNSSTLSESSLRPGEAKVGGVAERSRGLVWQCISRRCRSGERLAEPELCEPPELQAK